MLITHERITNEHRKDFSCGCAVTVGPKVSSIMTPWEEKLHHLDLLEEIDGWWKHVSLLQFCLVPVLL